ncbi:hypothetical protein EDC01DRAFT_409506 [Geopyxis carbonaria]|nr:hypothetical protein EDC01DRAFT_409506 [Geopyxis carbonaria]
MPFYGGEKWACYSCTKGHRSSKCQHVDRILYKVRKPGRPLNNCPHVLPETIQPGTFVNTSAESMANGRPPKEACNCKNEMVQVAIPKVKHCSCTTASDPDKPQSTGPGLGSDPQNTVKTGRVTKPNARRKKSIINEGMARAANVEAGSEEGEIPTPTVANLRNSGNSEPGPSCPERRELASQPLVHRQVHATQHTFQQAMITGMASPTWPSISSSDPNNHILPYHDNQSQPIKFAGIESLASENMIPYMQQTPTPFTGMVTMPPMRPKSGNQPFLDATTDHFQDGGAQLVERIVISSFGSNPESQNTRGVNNNEKIMVPLTHHEYLWIQAARSAGVNFAELPKFISQPQQRQKCQTQDTSTLRNETMNHVATPLLQDSVKSATSHISKGKGICCSSKRDPTFEEVSSGPSSPNCKCGEACLCVPCADHPNNPAMREHIKDNMQLIQTFDLGSRPGKGTTSGCCSSNEQSPAAMYENHRDEQSPDPIIPGELPTLDDFVFYNYNYAGMCSEGGGGCMCGEGCTCVGCLTHGGHDGVSLESIGQETSVERGGRNESN